MTTPKLVLLLLSFLCMATVKSQSKMFDNVIDVEVRNTVEIVNNKQIVGYAIFYKIEDQPVDFVTYYSTGEPNPMPLQEGLYYQSEYTLVPHFIVFVPTSILTASIQINISGIVDYYKIAGKKYTIQPY